MDPLWQPLMGAAIRKRRRTVSMNQLTTKKEVKSDFIKFAPAEIKLDNPENSPSPSIYGMFVVVIVGMFV